MEETKKVWSGPFVGLTSHSIYQIKYQLIGYDLQSIVVILFPYADRVIVFDPDSQTHPDYPLAEIQREDKIDGYLFV